MLGHDSGRSNWTGPARSKRRRCSVRSGPDPDKAMLDPNREGAQRHRTADRLIGVSGDGCAVAGVIELKAMEGALEVSVFDPTQRELRPAMRADVEGSTDLAEFAL